MRDWMALKHLLRTGWVRSGVSEPESVAAHSWGMAILAMKLCPDNLDRLRVIEMCIIHDLAEVVVGDLTPHDDVSNKAEEERLAMLELAPYWIELFDEYETGISAESRFVKYLDKLDMAIMAQLYQDEQGLELGEFIASARETIGETDLD